MTKETIELNNPIFKKAMGMLIGKHFIVSGFEMFHHPDPNGIELTHIRVDFIEISDRQPF